MNNTATDKTVCKNDIENWSVIYPSINGDCCCWRILHLLAIWKHKEGDELNMQLSFHRDRRLLSACIHTAAGVAVRWYRSRCTRTLQAMRNLSVDGLFHMLINKRHPSSHTTFSCKWTFVAVKFYDAARGRWLLFYCNSFSA